MLQTKKLRKSYGTVVGVIYYELGAINLSFEGVTTSVLLYYSLFASKKYILGN